MGVLRGTGEDITDLYQQGRYIYSDSNDVRKIMQKLFLTVDTGTAAVEAEMRFHREAVSTCGRDVHTTIVFILLSVANFQETREHGHAVENMFKPEWCARIGPRLTH